jgi:hypothetical protein
MVAMLIRVEYLGDSAAFGTLEGKRADKRTAEIVRVVAAQRMAQE